MLNAVVARIAVTAPDLIDVDSGFDGLKGEELTVISSPASRAERGKN